MRKVKLAPPTALNTHSLEDGKLTIRISIAYRDGADAVWKLKSIQEVTVRGAGSSPHVETKDPKPV